MVTIRIKDTQSKQARALIAMLKTFSFVEVLDEETQYDSEFVDKILKSASEKERIKVDPDNIWESIK